jgi:hypothetical protein
METAIQEAAAQAIRIKYRSRVENALAPYQLAAMLMQRATDGTEQHTINTVAIDAATLTKIGKALASLAVAQCNREWLPRDETRRRNLTEQAEALAAGYGLTVTAHGDPRGYVLRLHGEGIYRNGWGDGFGVA